MKKWFSETVMTWIFCALLALVTVVAYLPVMDNNFINLDDPAYVTQNPHVRAGLTGDALRWALVSVEHGNWHPLTWLSHELDCQLYGLNPAGHHLTSLAFHVTNTLLVFLLLLNLTLRRWPSMFVALLFGLHPMHVESVAWVAERKDVLSGFFFLLTLLIYARYVEVQKTQPRIGRTLYGASLGMFALGLMAKPMLVTVPFVLCLLDYWPLQRFRFPLSSQPAEMLRRLALEKVPFLLLTGLSCAVTIFAQAKGYAVVSTNDLPLETRLEHVPIAYGWYLLKLFCPNNLSVYYPFHYASVDSTLAAGGLALLVAITGLTVWLARKQPFLLASWLWFLGTLIPVIGLVQVGQQAYANRYTYLPYIGLFIMLAWGLHAFLSGRTWGKPVLGSISVLITAVCFLLTREQVRAWNNDLTLYHQALAQDQKNEFAWYGLGLESMARGDLDQATEEFKKTTDLNPGFNMGWNSLGLIYFRQGKNDEAINAFQAGVLNGGQLVPALLFNRAAVYSKTGKFKEAIEDLQRSLELNPQSAIAHASLGRSYWSDQQTERAAAEFEAALQLQPDMADAKLCLALIRAGAGQTAESITNYRAVLALDTNSLIALNNLAWALATATNANLRNGQEAVQLASRACELTKYQDTIYIGTLAAAYAESGDFERAIATAQRACTNATLNGESSLYQRNQQLIELYRSHQPVRE